MTKEQVKLNMELRNKYANKINYYKRVIHFKGWDLDSIDQFEAYRLLGYWEGRYDEATKINKGGCDDEQI